jgi:hypothetical protein
MRRKILQDFANLFFLKLIDLPSGYDLASFAHHGAGLYAANILRRGLPSLDLLLSTMFFLSGVRGENNVT